MIQLEDRDKTKAREGPTSFYKRSRLLYRLCSSLHYHNHHPVTSSTSAPFEEWLLPSRPLSTWESDRVAAAAPTWTMTHWPKLEWGIFGLKSLKSRVSVLVSILVEELKRPKVLSSQMYHVKKICLPGIATHPFKSMRRYTRAHRTTNRRISFAKLS